MLLAAVHSTATDVANNKGYWIQHKTQQWTAMHTKTPDLNTRLTQWQIKCFFSLPCLQQDVSWHLQDVSDAVDVFAFDVEWSVTAHFGALV